MTAGPALILGGIVVLAALVYPLRAWMRLAAFVAAAAAFALAVWGLTLSLDEAITIGGRTIMLGEPLRGLGYTLAITELERPPFVMLSLIAAVSFIGMWLQQAERSFLSIGLILLALWMATIMVQPATGALSLLALASCLAAFALPRAPRTAFRQLWWPLVAYPLGAIAAWHAQEAAFAVVDVEHLQIAARLMGLALLVLLAPIPLHAPAVSLLADAPPLIGAFLLLGSQVVVLHTIWSIFVEWSWMAQQIEVSRFLAIAGLATMLWGALGAMTADRVQRLWAYAALHDWGVLLLGLSLGAPLEWRTAAVFFVSRSVGVCLSAYGVASLRTRLPGDDWVAVQGQMRRLPWTALAILVGGLGLCGFPLTASFAARWGLSQTLLITEPVWALLIVAGQLGVALGYLHLLQAFLAPAPPEARPARRETIAGVVLLTFGVFFSGVLALAPQSTDGIVQTITGLMRGLGPLR